MQGLQPVGVFIDCPERCLIILILLCDPIHDAIYAHAHQLVQCRLFVHKNASSFRSWCMLNPSLSPTMKRKKYIVYGRNSHGRTSAGAAGDGHPSGARLKTACFTPAADTPRMRTPYPLPRTDIRRRTSPQRSGRTKARCRRLAS